MKRFLAGIVFFLLSFASVSGEPPLVWERQVSAGRYRGDLYTLTKPNEAFCSVEYVGEGDFVFLKAKSPIIQNELYITTKLIFLDHSESSAAIFDYRTMPDGKKQFVNFRFIDPTDENDVFRKECADPMKNGVTIGPEGKNVPIQEFVKKAFRGEYGIGTQ